MIASVAISYDAIINSYNRSNQTLCIILFLQSYKMYV